jgi:hypothetical protein
MRRNSTIAVVAGAAMALSVVGCGGSDSPSTSTAKKSMKGAGIGKQGRTVVGGSATFTSNATTAGELKKAGVAFTPTKNSPVKGASVIVPVKSGIMVVSTLVGATHGPGSIVFAANGKKVAFNNIAVNTRLRRVTGTVDGKKKQLYHMSVTNLQHTQMKSGSVTGTGMSVTLAKQAASTLNKGLGVKVFKKGLKMGSVTLVVETKKSGSGSTTAKAKATTKAATTTTKSGK